MKKIKAILIAHASHSVWSSDSQKTIKEQIIGDWFSLTGKQIKKYYPEIDIECWCPEKVYKKQREFVSFKIKYRQFPTTFSPMYALDLSIPMLKELKKEIQKAKKENYKLIIHLHEYHNLHGLIIASFFKNQNIIAQHHGGSWPLKHANEVKRYKLFFPAFLLGQIWENRILKNIKYFYALSPQEIQYLKRVAPNSEIKFQTMGIDEFYFESMDKKTSRKKLGWPLDKKIMLFLGRVNHIKGIPYLIDVMKDLKEIEAKIVGWGDEKKYTEEVKKKKINNIEFLGPVFGKNKLSYLSAADFFILPSTKEGASVSTMEALAQNLPVIVTNVGGMPLMVQNGREGIVIEPKSSEKIIKAVKEILKWKKNVKKYAKRYKWKKIIDETVKDYREI